MKGRSIFLSELSEEDFDKLAYLLPIILGEKKMENLPNVLNEVTQVAEAVAPQSIASQAVEAAVSTAADPSILNIVSDLELAHTLLNEFRSKIAGLHPTVANIFKAFF